MESFEALKTGEPDSLQCDGGVDDMNVERIISEEQESPLKNKRGVLRLRFDDDDCWEVVVLCCLCCMWRFIRLGIVALR